ncbi:hypothetical protein C2845_PM01G32310 [Panicum miliaceum]|uniref:Uncharacterized protein n=1 Tax=Panicum miliaceum TaxID=4540 RepID=A0A3L6TM72_PANMI|nr:hypothetical protein C2845_PM01G32310 [Panicum miliaceum]
MLRATNLEILLVYCCAPLCPAPPPCHTRPQRCRLSTPPHGQAKRTSAPVLREELPDLEHGGGRTGRTRRMEKLSNLRLEASIGRPELHRLAARPPPPPPGAPPPAARAPAPRSDRPELRRPSARPPMPDWICATAAQAPMSRPGRPVRRPHRSGLRPEDVGERAEKQEEERKRRERTGGSHVSCNKGKINTDVRVPLATVKEEATVKLES